MAQEQHLVTMKRTDTSHQTINEKGSRLSSLKPQLSEAVLRHNSALTVMLKVQNENANPLMLKVDV